VRETQDKTTRWDALSLQGCARVSSLLNSRAHSFKSLREADSVSPERWQVILASWHHNTKHQHRKQLLILHDSEPKMPPKVMHDIVSYTTDPATKRPDFGPAKEMGQNFQGLHLAGFSYQINLLATAQPSDPWRIFRLFITTEMVAIIISFANEKVSQLPGEGISHVLCLNPGIQS